PAPHGTAILPSQDSVELWQESLYEMLNPTLATPWLDSLDRPQLIAKAWEAWREPFPPPFTGSPSPGALAGAPAMLCAALAIGPSKALGSSKLLNSPLAQMTLAAWGTAFEYGLRRDGGGEEMRCPWWLSIAVLGELGFSSAVLGLANALLNRSSVGQVSTERSW